MLGLFILLFDHLHNQAVLPILFYRPGNYRESHCPRFHSCFLVDPDSHAGSQAPQLRLLRSTVPMLAHICGSGKIDMQHKSVQIRVSSVICSSPLLGYMLKHLLMITQKIISLTEPPFFVSAGETCSQRHGGFSVSSVISGAFRGELNLTQLNFL